MDPATHFHLPPKRKRKEKKQNKKPIYTERNIDSSEVDRQFNLFNVFFCIGWKWVPLNEFGIQNGCPCNSWECTGISSYMPINHNHKKTKLTRAVTLKVQKRQWNSNNKLSLACAFQFLHTLTPRNFYCHQSCVQIQGVCITSTYHFNVCKIYDINWVPAQVVVRSFFAWLFFLHLHSEPRWKNGFS